jgi:LPS sulfotransferase NodH
MTTEQGLDRPVFIVSPPRSGSSLLFRTLMKAPGVFTIGGESHGLIESVAPLHPAARGWESNRLVAADATPEIVRQLAARFRAALRDRDGKAPAGPARMIEKTPKNSLRIPFLRAAFPDAIFVYLHRDPRETLSSMIEAWASGRFRTYPRLPGWPGGSWSLLLTPGWREWLGLPLEERVARQWAATSATLVADLDSLGAEAVRVVSFDVFIRDPQATVAALCRSLGLGWDRPLASPLPPSPSVVSAPRPGKWRSNAAAIERIWPIVAREAARAEEFARQRAIPAGGDADQLLPKAGAGKGDWQ